MCPPVSLWAGGLSDPAADVSLMSAELQRRFPALWPEQIGDVSRVARVDDRLLLIVQHGKSITFSGSPSLQLWQSYLLLGPRSAAENTGPGAMPFISLCVVQGKTPSYLFRFSVSWGILATQQIEGMCVRTLTVSRWAPGA